MKAKASTLIFSAILSLTLTAASYAASETWSNPYNTKSALIGRETFAGVPQTDAFPRVAQDYSTKRAPQQQPPAIDSSAAAYDADSYNTKLAVRGQRPEEVGVAVVK